MIDDRGDPETTAIVLALITASVILAAAIIQARATLRAALITSGESSGAAQRASKRGKFLVTAGIVIALVTVSGLGLWFVFSDRNQPTSDELALTLTPDRTAITTVQPTPFPVPSTTPFPTPSLNATSTSVLLISTQPPFTEPPPSPTPRTSSSFHVDLGVLESEASFELQGWGAVEGAEDGTIPSTSDDYTLRNMLLRSDNSITFSNISDGDYLLIAEVGDGYCDDGFIILAGEELQEIYSYSAVDSENVSFGPKGQHEVQIPGSSIHDATLVITFRNTARDDCGLAGVYNIRLQRID